MYMAAQARKKETTTIFGVGDGEGRFWIADTTTAESQGLLGTYLVWWQWRVAQQQLRMRLNVDCMATLGPYCTLLMKVPH
jgi:hypothetical protein